MSAEGFRARARPEPPSAQILVVVANTLERSWRTDAEKGFLSTAVAQVLVDPKPRAKALQRGPHDAGSPLARAGNPARAPNPRGARTQRTNVRAGGPPDSGPGAPVPRPSDPSPPSREGGDGPGADAAGEVTSPARESADRACRRPHPNGSARRLALLGAAARARVPSGGGKRIRASKQRSDMAKGNPVKIPGPGE